MDHGLRMEIHRGYAAEDGLDFGSQQPSCSSSARSFSTTSSSDPYTSTSGRSTPHQAPGSMANFDPFICSSSSMAYELTPPASELESYFPMGVKSEYSTDYPPALSNCATMMRTPGEKYEPDMNIALHQMPDSLFHGMYSVESASSQPLQQYSFPVQQHMRHPPSSVPTGGYMLPNSEFDTFQSWDGEPENIHGDWYPRPAASMMPAEQFGVPMPNKSPRCSGSLASNGRKRRIKQVQQKTKNLRRAQSKQAEYPEVEDFEEEDWSDVECGGIRVRTEGKAAHFCQFVGCKKSFRRLEHLKRHHDTVHCRYKEWICEFCPPQKGPKVFNRFDNYRSHVILHTKRPSTSSKRTNYHPAAAARLAMLEAQMKVRNKKRMVCSASDEAAPSTTSTTGTTARPPGAAEENSSPTPSSSTGAYTPGSSHSRGSVEDTPLTAARQGLRRLGLEDSASPAV